MVLLIEFLMFSVRLVNVIALLYAMTLTNDRIPRSNDTVLCLNAGTPSSARHHAPWPVSDLVYMVEVVLAFMPELGPGHGRELPAMGCHW